MISPEVLQSLADARAAEENETAETGKDEAQHVLIFRLRNVLMGVYVTHVEGLHEGARSVRLPGAPSHVLGLAHVGDQAVPMLDAAEFLGMPKWETHDEDASGNRMMLIRSRTRMVSVLCDRILGIVEVSPLELRSPELTRADALRKYLTAEFESTYGMTALIDMDVLLDDAEVRE